MSLIGLDTPLHLAFRQGHEELAEYLLPKVKNVQIKNRSGNTAFQEIKDNVKSETLQPLKPIDGFGRNSLYQWAKDKKMEKLRKFANTDTIDMQLKIGIYFSVHVRHYFTYTCIL